VASHPPRAAPVRKPETSKRSPPLRTTSGASQPKIHESDKRSELWWLPIYRTQVPCTCNCKVNSERYLRQHLPQRVVFINPRYPESRLRNPELLAAPGAMHHGLHAPQSLCKIAIQNHAAHTPNQGCQKIAGWSAQRHYRDRSPRCSEFESARMSPSKLGERNGNGR
jgi:hypothetical protein